MIIRNAGKAYYKTHIATVNSRIPTAIKTALGSDEIGYPRLFKGLINTKGGLSAKMEINQGGSVGIYGEPKLSSLYDSTDFPTIKGGAEGNIVYSKGSVMISKVASSLGAFLEDEQQAIESINRDVDALFMSHAHMDDSVLIGGVKKLELQSIYGIGNHPDIGRVDNTTGKLFKDMTALEIYTELKAQIQDFVQNVNPAGSNKQTPIRKITVVMSPDIYLICAMAEIVVGNDTVSVIEKLTKDMAVVGGIKFVDNGAVAEIKHQDPNNSSKCAIIGYFDGQFIEARIPAPTNLLAGNNGDASHIDDKSSFQSLFVSKCLGIMVKNISTGANKLKPLRVMQGL